MNANNLLDEAKAMEQEILTDRRFLHSHPETGFDLTETKEYVRKKLIEIGFEPKDCGKSGLVVLAGGSDTKSGEDPAAKASVPKGYRREWEDKVSGLPTGKTFLLRADMDALPIQEQSDVTFPSVNEGKMHACGHDMHTAMLLGAARLLKKHEKEIVGTVKLCFQPAEEIFEGSHDMIEAGLLKNPDVDAALMIHVMAGVPFQVGSVIVCGGGVSAPAADYFRIEIQGRGCHGAMPQLGIDPITVAAHMITALQELHARELAMSDEAALTFGIMQAGNAENVIPDTALLGGTLRTYDEDTRCYLKQRMSEIAESIAHAFRAEAKVTFTSGCPTLFNSAELSSCVTGYCKELLGSTKAFSTAQITAMSGASKTAKSTGSEDFSYVSHEVPSIMLALAAGQPEKGYCYPQHHPMVKFDEDALVPGSCVYAYAAIRWLEEHI